MAAGPDWAEGSRGKTPRFVPNALETVLLEAIRSADHLSATDISNLSGIARATVVDIIAGKRRGSTRAYQAILDACHVEVGWRPKASLPVVVRQRNTA